MKDQIIATVSHQMWNGYLNGYWRCQITLHTDLGQIWHVTAGLRYTLPCQILSWSTYTITLCLKKKKRPTF